MKISFYSTSLMAIIVTLNSNNVFADGRDSSYGTHSHSSVYSAPNTYVAPYSKYSVNAKWIDHGQGNWYSWFGSVESANYNGYTMYDVSFDICRLSCEYNNYCTGIEYRSSHEAGKIGTGWYRKGNDAKVHASSSDAKPGEAYTYSKCEVHYDPYGSCKKDPHVTYTHTKWDNYNYGKGEWDGCWQKKLNYNYAANLGVTTNSSVSIVTTNPPTAFAPAASIPVPPPQE